MGKSNTQLTNEANIRIAQMTNEMNKAIADEANANNYAIQQGTNAANIQMNEENNMLQRQLQKEMNEYNSVGAQLERAREAGVNPNAVVQGTLSGNTQTTLPSMQAGRADSTQFQIANPMIAPHMENPYMEKIATIQTIEQIANDFMNRQKTIAETENVKAGTQTIQIGNRYEDNLKGLQVAIARGQAKNIEEATSYIQTQNQTLQEQQNVFKANVALMDEQRYGQFLDNYFKEDSINSFVKATKERLQKAGIPKDQWVSDATIKAYYYGVLPNNDLTLSQTQLNQIKANETKANTNLINQTAKFTKAKTKGQIIENYIAGKYGEDQAKADIESTKQSTEESKARTRGQEIENKGNRFKESDIYQGYIINGYALENAKLASDINNTNADTDLKKSQKVNTDVDTGKKAAETIRTGVQTLRGF